MYLIETDRLHLREFQIADAQRLFELNADPEVIRYTGDPPFKNVEEAKHFVRNYDSYKKHGFGRWAVLKKGSENLIGWCGLKRNELNEIDLGYRFFKEEWGKGYATEASFACLEYGFDRLNLNSIMARGAKANGASIRVMKKLKMSFWKEDTCKGIENSIYYQMSGRRFELIKQLDAVKVLEKEQLSPTEKESILNLWNREYPSTLLHKNLNSFDQYLMALSNHHHTMLFSNNILLGWFFAFIREGDRWFGMIVNRDLQGLGLGTKLLNMAQQRYPALNGWVIDKEGSLRQDGSFYKVPLDFYLKNHFVVKPNKRLEHSSISAVKIQWSEKERPIMP